MKRALSPILGLFLAGDRRMLLGGALLSAVTALFGVALLGLSGWFITATAIAGLTTLTALTFDVFMPSAGIRLLALGRTAARYGERLATHDATLGVLAALREKLFRGWAAPGAAADLARRPSRLLFRLTLDIDALDSLYLRVLVPLTAALLVALAAGVALLPMNPWLGAGFALLLLGAGLGLPWLGARAARAPSRRRARGLESLRARAIDLVTGQTELLMAGRLPAHARSLAEADHRLAATDERLNRIETGIGAGLGMLAAVALAGMLLAVAALAEQGAIGAPVAALALLVALAAFEPFAALRRGAVELGRSLLAAGRVAPRLGAPPAEAPRHDPPVGTAARLTDLGLRHPAAAAPSLAGIGFSLAAGERLALVGASGAGKSTLLGLLAGEFEPTAGALQRRDATLLTQRSELFQDSLRDNLRLADPAADDALLLDALEAAGLAETVAEMPQGLDTRLGEGGHGLSGGQARRLALARLFLRDTPLWLLDEPTEGLDRDTARDVLARLARRAGRRSLVIATHLRREASLADRLVLLDQGRVTAIVSRGEPGFAAALAALRPD